ncbi:MAG: holin family protein [Cypionkella sp.]|nr:holin family protein [Cypionkella sp.]
MGLIGKILGGGGGASAVGEAVQGVAEVFRPNATRQLELSAQVQEAALAQLGAEFSQAGQNWFDSFINGLNRLPRPLLALGTVGLFAFAMIDPPAFAQRMVGLNAVPEPLWWLLGAVVAFYFGARETHYFRTSRKAGGQVMIPQLAAPITQAPESDLENPALADWRGVK